MKNIFKLFLPLVLLIVLSFEANAQTNVSGGIYSNTTWTLANSPYIVTDTVVVFPGVTLTIEPGVVVKFNTNVRLEIRQATLITQGTSSDSITFTKNTSSNWSCIFLNGANKCILNYCNISYSDMGIYSEGGDSLIIEKSTFKYNNNGITSNGINLVLDSSIFNNNITGINNSADNLYIDNCNFKYNSIGITTWSDNIIEMNFCNFISDSLGIKCTNGTNADIGSVELNNINASNNQIGVYSDLNSQFTLKNSILDSNSVQGLYIGIEPWDSIINNEIKYNGTGINSGRQYLFATKNIIDNNNIGIFIKYPYTNNIFCNKICNNTSYDFYYNVAQGSNISIPNNYWCTTDSAIVESHIYDGYDNINKGLVYFMPIDTLQCYLTTDVPTITPQNISFNIYPNPANDHFTLETPGSNAVADIRIYNILGEAKYHSSIKNQKTIIDVSNFAKGVYIIEVNSGKKISRQKFIKQ